MAEKIARNNVCGTLKIYDGTTPTPLSLELKFDNGNLTITPGGEETHNRYDRHELVGAVKGKEMPSDISFECDFVELYSESGDSTPTVFEALNQVGDAAAWVSRIVGNKYGVKLEWTVVNPDSTGEDETISFDKCYLEPGGFTVTENEDTSKFSVKVKSLDNLPTVTRA